MNYACHIQSIYWRNITRKVSIKELFKKGEIPFYPSILLQHHIRSRVNIVDVGVNYFVLLLKQNPPFTFFAFHFSHTFFRSYSPASAEASLLFIAFDDFLCSDKNVQSSVLYYITMLSHHVDWKNILYGNTFTLK